jgi:hypothetical protein
MILVCGIPSETPLRMVIAQLERRGVAFRVFNQRRFATSAMWFEIDRQGIRGQLRLDDEAFALDEIHAVYSRLMDDQLLPELAGEAPDSPRRRQCRALHDTLLRWMEISPGLAINRCAPMASNSSKPFQNQLIREQGFLTPETLITNDPALVREFRAQHGRIIYKSISAVRSIVQEVSDADEQRLHRIRACPTQFQVFVEGTNVRVHTIGGEVFATAVCSEATDYRYAARQAGLPAELRDVRLSPELSEQCLRLARTLGLEFAGIDLKITPEDDVYCFEVNPCPAFSYYEANTEQAISAAVAHYLARGDSSSAPP